MNASYNEHKTTTRNASVSHQEYVYKLDELCAHIRYTLTSLSKP